MAAEPQLAPWQRVVSTLSYRAWEEPVLMAPLFSDVMTLGSFSVPQSLWRMAHGQVELLSAFSG